MDEWTLDEELESQSIYSGMPPPFRNSIDSNETWCDGVDDYLKNLSEKCKTEAEVHHKNKIYYNRLRHSLGIPSCIIGVIMGALTDETPDYIHRIAFISNALICALSYYFDFNTKMKLNSKSFNKYTELSNNIEQVVSLPRDKRASCKNTVDDFSKLFMSILSDSP